MTREGRDFFDFVAVLASEAVKCCVTGLIRGRLNRDQSWGYVSENACQLVKRRKSSGFTTRGFSEMPLTLSSAELPLFFFWHFCNLCLLSVFLYLLFFNEIMKSTDTGPFSSLVFLGPPATVISLKHPQCSSSAAPQVLSAILSFHSGSPWRLAELTDTHQGFVCFN